MPGSPPTPYHIERLKGAQAPFFIGCHMASLLPQVGMIELTSAAIVDSI